MRLNCCNAPRAPGDRARTWPAAERDHRSTPCGPDSATPLSFVGHASHPRHRAGAAASGARAARSTSGRSSWRGAGRPSAGTPTSRPPGRQHEHERHLKAINEAADELERIAEDSRGGQRQPQRGEGQRGRGAQGARGGRPAGVRGGAARARGGRGARARTTRSARACPTTRSSTATPAACPTPSGGSAGRGHLLHRRRRRRPAVGSRAVPAGVRTVPPGRCSSSTSPSPTRAPSACSGS